MQLLSYNRTICHVKVMSQMERDVINNNLHLKERKKKERKGGKTFLQSLELT